MQDPDGNHTVAQETATNSVVTEGGQQSSTAAPTIELTAETPIIAQQCAAVANQSKANDTASVAAHATSHPRHHLMTTIRRHVVTDSVVMRMNYVVTEVPLSRLCPTSDACISITSPSIVSSHIISSLFLPISSIRISSHRISDHRFHIRSYHLGSFPHRHNRKQKERHMCFIVSLLTCFFSVDWWGRKANVLKWYWCLHLF